MSRLVRVNFVYFKTKQAIFVLLSCYRDDFYCSLVSTLSSDSIILIGKSMGPQRRIVVFSFGAT